MHGPSDLTNCGCSSSRSASHQDYYRLALITNPWVFFFSMGNGTLPCSKFRLGPCPNTSHRCPFALAFQHEMESYRSNWQPNRQEPYFQVADTITSEWFRLASWMQVFSPSATKMETQACSNLTQRLGLIANLHVLTLQFHRRSWLSLALLWMAILLEYWIIFFFFFEPAKYFVPNLSIDLPSQWTQTHDPT
jgi:hypothetical protein